MNGLLRGSVTRQDLTKGFLDVLWTSQKVFHKGL
jgi:hypothetical protein